MLKLAEKLNLHIIYAPSGNYQDARSAMPPNNNF
jgi:hypothetical protein